LHETPQEYDAGIFSIYLKYCSSQTHELFVEGVRETATRSEGTSSSLKKQTIICLSFGLFPPSSCQFTFFQDLQFDFLLGMQAVLCA